MQECAFVNPPWMLEREGASYVQVTELLYRVAELCTGANTIDDIAQKIGAAGKPVSPATIRTLVAQLLIPRGLVEMADGSVVPVAAGGASPLQLNMRMKMISPEAVTPVTKILRVLYWPPVMLIVLAIAGLAEAWLYTVHGIGAGLHDAIYTPGYMLIVLLVVVVSAAFHELGHATALHYAGGKIKGMGAGVYIVYPAFFTDVSDNYRLPRWKRVRTDLGGFYFNLIFALAVMGIYALSGHEFLLLMVLMINLEIIHQLLPFLRLDGYWTLADITGVPDFFTEMTAFVRSVLPVKAWKGRKLPELKWWAKVVFAIYTLITVPLLVFLLFLMVRSVPRVLATAWDSLGQQGHAFSQAQAQADVLGGLASAGQALLLLIPTAGLCYTLFLLGRRFSVAMWNWGKPNAIRRAVSGVCMIAAAGLLGFMWVPQVQLPGGAPPPSAGGAPPSLGPLSPVSWEPIGSDERGTIQDAVIVAPPPQPKGTAEPTQVAPAAPRATVAPVTDANTHPTPEPTAAPVATTVVEMTPTRGAGAQPTSVRVTITPTPVRTPGTPTALPTR